MKQLVGKEFLGIILPELDSDKMQGRYKVHIPDLMQHIDNSKGIWCKNQISKWEITTSRNGEYGQHFPLHPDTRVIVKFFKEDINTGYIERTVSDEVINVDVEAQDCTTLKGSPKDRDEQYIIFKTPKKFNIFYVNEDTSKEPNSIFLVYNRDSESGRRTVLKIDDEGLHVYTRDNKYTRVILDEAKQIDQNQYLYVKGNQQKNIEGNETKQIIGTTIFNNTGAVYNVSNTFISSEAPMIYLNCGITMTAPSKKSVKHLENNGTSEDLGKTPNTTTKFNNTKRDTLAS